MSTSCVYCYKPCRYSAARGLVCEACYTDRLYGFDQARREAERVAGIAEQAFIVVELDPTTRASARQAKFGRKAYSVWSARERKHAYRIVEEYGPEGRVWQSSEAP